MAPPVANPPRSVTPRHRGFTLLELLVVLLLISLVAGVVGPNVLRAIRSAELRDAQRRLAAELSTLPGKAFAQGQAIEVDAATLQRAVPAWPADWRLETSGPLRYAANGMAEGGWLVLRRPGQADLRWRIERITGELSVAP
jgi:general secretion pathway protein H